MQKVHKQTNLAQELSKLQGLEGQLSVGMVEQGNDPGASQKCAGCEFTSSSWASSPWVRRTGYLALWRIRTPFPPILMLAAVAY